MAQVDLSSDHDPDYSLERHQQVSFLNLFFSWEISQHGMALNDGSQRMYPDDFTDPPSGSNLWLCVKCIEWTAMESSRLIHVPLRRSLNSNLS